MPRPEFSLTLAKGPRQGLELPGVQAESPGLAAANSADGGKDGAKGDRFPPGKDSQESWPMAGGAALAPGKTWPKLSGGYLEDAGKRQPIRADSSF